MASRRDSTERRLVRAITTGTVWTPDTPTGVSFAEGDVFPRDAEHVKRAPKYFMPVDATIAEIHAAKVAIHEHEINQESYKSYKPTEPDPVGYQFIRR